MGIKLLRGLDDDKFARAIQNATSYRNLATILGYVDNTYVREYVATRAQALNLSLFHFRFGPARHDPGQVLANKRAREKRASTKLKVMRQQPEHRARFVYKDLKQYDRKHGLAFALTIAWIASNIQRCSYCDEEQLRISLDRIDNALGHTQDNVVASCARCNFLRRDMPYQAWIAIAPSVKVARLAGLFGSWVGGPQRYHAPDTSE